jgi:hypothetical protein
MTMTRIDRTVAVNNNLSAARDIAEKMTDDERQVFATYLGQLSAAKQVSSPQGRLDSVKAAAKSEDRRVSQAYVNAVNGLRRLGFELDQICASGATRDLDAAMKKARWSSEQRIDLKLNLTKIGAIAVK